MVMQDSGEMRRENDKSWLIVGWQSEACPPISFTIAMVGPAQSRLCPPYDTAV
jgi:hypothetical protein